MMVDDGNAVYDLCCFVSMGLTRLLSPPFCHWEHAALSVFTKRCFETCYLKNSEKELNLPYFTVAFVLARVVALVFFKKRKTEKVIGDT